MESSNLGAREVWPSQSVWDAPGPLPVGIVTVNYNTRDLIAGLLFSLYRLLGSAEFGRIVVVDNGSSDGSLDFLRAAEGAGLIDLIANDANRYHGPALTQGVSLMAQIRTVTRTTDWRSTGHRRGSGS